MMPSFCRATCASCGVVDSADLPLNVSREMIQDSPLLAAIRKGVTNRVVADLAKLAETDTEAFGMIWGEFRRRPQGRPL